MQFLQSIRDFPQMVKLGDTLPSFGLNRFSQELLFTPVDDEGFTVRGDRRRLEYKGRRRSHRFTILGDGSFEYDCILRREPESNVIALRIEGGDKFNFYQQPDFVKEPYLKNSYAVYKKERLSGDGTGKLCHIHRPEIIDAGGRRCWGTLSVTGDELRITIPEKWLGEAKYPVVVDPVIGTNSIGSLNYYTTPYYDTYSGSWIDIMNKLECDNTMLLNKFLLSENFSSMSMINFYVYKGGDKNGLRIIRTTPCMYNNVSNLPKNKISNYETTINDPYSVSQAGWLTGSFMKSGSVKAGDYIWFGVSGCYLVLNFDYGGILSKIDVAYSNSVKKTMIPTPLGDSLYSPYKTDEYIRDILISMYLDYEAERVNYKKYLAETAGLGDTNSTALTFIRKLAETAGLEDLASKALAFFRKCLITAGSGIMINGSLFIKKFYSVIETVLTDTRLYIKIEYKRKFTETMKVLTAVSKAQEFFRNCVTSAGNCVRLNGSLFMKGLRSVIDTVLTGTKLFVKVEYNRKCTQAMKAASSVSKKQSFFRQCLITVGNGMRLNGIGAFNRICSVIDRAVINTRLLTSREINAGINDRVKAGGIVKRKLFVFLRIAANTVARSFIINRFLNAKIEITLKSRIGDN
jgi:hypothetical protein